MAKKKSSVRASKSKAPARPEGTRKEPYVSDRLRALVTRLREQSMRLSGIARAMDDSGVETIVVDGHAMLIRGLNQIDNFADNCSRAIREECSRRETA